MSGKIDRREALAVLGTVSLSGVLAACGKDDGSGTTATSARREPQATSATAELFDRSPACSLSPEETEGPYYFDVDSIRRDIRENRDGVPLRLGVRVRDAGACKPVEDAVVEVWHCDALGLYSGFEEASQGPGGGRTDRRTYLRGAQVTNADGIVEFVTVYPGWYMGRTVHIHAKVHLDKQTVLTSQFYFDDDLSTAVYKRRPYSGRTGRDTFNDTDGIFDRRLLLSLARHGDGYLGAINLDVQSPQA